MKPILFELGPITIYSYGAIVAMAILVAYQGFLFSARKNGYEDSLISGLAFVILFSGIAGARLFYVAQHWTYYKENLIEILWISRGGLVWYGSFIAALFFGILYLKVKKVLSFKILDVLVPWLAFAQAIGRVGCFFNGCCYGVLASPPLGCCPFANQGVSRIPSQLITSILLFLLAIILLALLRKKISNGLVAASYGIGYSLIRFFVEFLRGDQSEVFLGWTLPQCVSVGLFIFSILCFAYLARIKR